jgi:RNA polymerase sigma factor (sigma-70 family)
MSGQSPPSDLLRHITAARRGDREALGRVLAVMRPYLLAVEKGRGKAGTNGEAEDLVQEAICHAVRSFPQFAGTTAEELRGWLRQILLNAARDWDKHWRADRRHPRREVQADDGARLKEQLTARADGPVAGMIRQERISTIRLALDELKDETVKSSPCVAGKNWPSRKSARGWDGPRTRRANFGSGP